MCALCDSTNTIIEFVPKCMLLKPRQSFRITLYIGLHVKHPLSLSDFKETWIFSTYFWKLLKNKFHEDPSSGSQVLPGGRKDTHDELNSRFLQFGEYIVTPPFFTPSLKPKRKIRNKRRLYQWRTEGGLGCSTPSLPEILKALQNRAKLNPIVKTVKNCWI